MEHQIKLIKNNDKKDLTDLEWMREFYKYLQENENLKLSKGKAFSIIYYLQEHLPVFPDEIEKCTNCGELFNSYAEGYYSEDLGEHYCECSANEAYYIDHPVKQEY